MKILGSPQPPSSLVAGFIPSPPGILAMARPDIVPLSPRRRDPRRILAGLAACVVLLGANAWGQVVFSTGTFSDSTVLLKAGPATQQVYGVNFGASTGGTTANGYVFGGDASTNITYAVSGNYPSFLSGGGTTGDPVFNAILNTGRVGSGTAALVLQSLTTGQIYNALFMVADTRNGMGTRSFSMTQGSATSPNQSYAYAGGTAAMGGYVLCTFTATGPTATFTLNLAPGRQLNAVLVCTVTGNSVSTPVAPADTTLQSVVTQNLPSLTPILDCGVAENSVIQPNIEAPLYKPYDSNDPGGDGWWDEVVDEQLQARFPSVMLTTTGTYSPNPAELNNCPGGAYGSNPYRYFRYMQALNRAGATGKLKFTCFARTDGGILSVYQQFYGLPSTAKIDLGNTSAYYDVFYLRFLKPWLDTVPQSSWFLVQGRLPVEFWSFGSTFFTNTQGNISALCNALAGWMYADYGVYPFFEVPGTGQDTTLDSCPHVLGNNGWFHSPNTPNTMLLYKGNRIGCLVPGACPRVYFDPSKSDYHNPNVMMPRNGLNGLGQNGDTFLLGLDAMVMNNALLTTIEGYTDYAEACGIYRSTAAGWDYPNQYLNLCRTYSDLRTVTARLQVEACDAYSDPGGTGGVYRRTGNLDIRALTGPPAASASAANSGETAAQAFDGKFNTKWFAAPAAPGWLQYDYGSGNKNVVTGYYLTSASDVPQRDPKDWLFQGSNDGSSWTTLDNRTGQTFAARLRTNSYDFANTTGYRYHRLYVTANFGGGSNGIQLADMMLKGTAATGGGWVVGPTVASEWVQFNEVFFTAGNYKFPVRYAATAAHSLQISIDGVNLPAVTVPSTGGMDTFNTVYVGAGAVTHGAHNVRLTFLDGGVDVDWIFLKKYDPMMSLKSAQTNCYLGANAGGNSVLVSGSATEGNLERFSVDDQSGAGVVTGGDTVNLQSYNGLYVSAAGGGGSGISVDVGTPANSEKFTMVKLNGNGSITIGDQVALRSNDGVHYLTVINGTTVNASGIGVGAAQTFTVNISPQ